MIAIDSRGRGHSDHDTDHTNYNCMTELGDIVSVLFELGVGPAAFVGSSRGGVLTMLLGAARFGCAEALIAELSSSQPEMLGRMKKSIPGMYDKAYRWVGEMQEISDFLDANAPSSEMYRGIAGLYQFLAAAEAEGQKPDDNAIKTLDKVLGR